MAAQTGRTNAKFIGVHIDNAAGTLTDLSAYCKSIGTVGLRYDEQDVTAYSDGVKNVTIGKPTADLQFVFQNDTVPFAQFIALSRVTPLTIDIRFGIRQTYTSGEPCFGITSSATSGYLLKDMTMTDTELTVTFSVFGPTAPDFATTPHS